MKIIIALICLSLIWTIYKIKNAPLIEDEIDTDLEDENLF